MNNPFLPGDIKHFERTVRPEDTAAFESGEVHPVYATFALARDAEWACRLFVLEMKEADEEGIGTQITVNHLSPALVGAKVAFKVTVENIENNKIVCRYKALVGNRLIATGTQTQKILKKRKIQQLFEKLKMEQ